MNKLSIKALQALHARDHEGAELLAIYNSGKRWWQRYSVFSFYRQMQKLEDSQYVTSYYKEVGPERTIERQGNRVRMYSLTQFGELFFKSHQRSRRSTAGDS